MQTRTGMLRVITIVILLISALGVINVVMTSQNMTLVLKVGQPAPDFTLQQLDGKSVKLSDFKGKVVMVNFWASWCEPCRKEIPFLEKAYENYKKDGFVVLGVNLKENTVTVNGFVNNYGITYPILLDKDQTVAVDIYKIKPIPTSFFIDRNGILRDKVEAPMETKALENNIVPLLDERDTGK